MLRTRKKKKIRPYDEIHIGGSMDSQIEIRELTAAELDELRELLDEY